MHDPEGGERWRRLSRTLQDVKFIERMILLEQCLYFTFRRLKCIFSYFKLTVPDLKSSFFNCTVRRNHVVPCTVAVPVGASAEIFGRLRLQPFLYGINFVQ